MQGVSAKNRNSPQVFLSDSVLVLKQPVFAILFRFQQSSITNADANVAYFKSQKAIIFKFKKKPKRQLAKSYGKVVCLVKKRLAPIFDFGHTERSLHACQGFGAIIKELLCNGQPSDNKQQFGLNFQ